MRIRFLTAILLALLPVLPSAALAKGAKRQPSSAPSPFQTLAPPVNDQCPGAIPIPCGNINLAGNTGLANNDYTFVDTLNSCTGYAADGRDVVYLLNVGPGDSLWLNYQNRNDGSMYIVTDCGNIDGTCVVGVDNFTTTNAVEQLRYRFTTGGTYYLILDSYGVNTGDLWTASGQLVCGASSPPTNDLCQTALPLGCGSFEFSGSTELANDNVTTPAQFSCTGFQALGKDVVYRMTVTAGDSIWLNYTSSTNASVYIVNDCNDVWNTCIWGEDQNVDGQPEVLSHKFAFSGTYYLVLDSRAPGSFGTYLCWGELVCVNPPPANDRCDTAYPVSCGPINWGGNTMLAVDDLFFPDSVETCTGYPANGPEVVYRVNANAGDSLHLVFDMNDADASFYIVSDCSDVWTYCVYGMDEAVTGDAETIDYTFPAAGTYYLIFDSVDEIISSPWTAIGSLTCNFTDVPDVAPARVLGLRTTGPNPFRSMTTLAYSLPQRGRTTLSVFDLQGREVRRLVDSEIEAGDHSAVWDGHNDQGTRLGPGVYFAHLASGSGQVVRRMIFIR